ncbi:uncharacterized protein BCR38DRAFT_430271 [Pseudomassariella vexata]|uniref:Uncharacterized protein n=1 Tax=Pseudomassariella vexata TaxID=1141098 RepID=A0A1Y2E4T4_9PEZI|nr:uncharacterized protein BCR38DRAFT_430271 [Pseudomassariella vexata]ORY66447.1 hypothetical protein BCR38DRAFT_430271 [Pseudomassariella vexata]
MKWFRSLLVQGDWRRTRRAQVSLVLDFEGGQTVLEKQYFTPKAQRLLFSSATAYCAEPQFGRLFPLSESHKAAYLYFDLLDCDWSRLVKKADPCLLTSCGNESKWKSARGACPPALTEEVWFTSGTSVVQNNRVLGAKNLELELSLNGDTLCFSPHEPSLITMLMGNP